MPWENADAFGNAAGAYAGYLSGKQDAKDRALKQSEQDEQDRQTAIANQTAVGYKDAMQKIAQQNADTRTTAESDTSTYHDAQLAEKTKNDLTSQANRALAIETTRIDQAANLGEKRWALTATIQAAHQRVLDMIAAGVVKTKAEVDAKYAAISASVDNNIRSTSTSAANNERTTATSAANNAATNAGALQRTNITQAGMTTRAGRTAAMQEYKTQLAANNTATAAGNDKPFPDLKPPAEAAAAPSAAPPNPVVTAFVTKAASIPKAQRVKLVTSSKPYLSADAATQQAILSAVQAMP